MSDELSDEYYRIVESAIGSRLYVDSLNKLHRLDGPARITPTGDEEWWKHGQLHRLDGPAVKHENIQEWWEEGRLHRLDGAAVIYSDGTREWYRYGMHIPNVVCRRDGKSIIFSDVYVGDYPSYHWHDDLCGFSLDDTDLALFALSCDLVEMPYG